MLFKTMSQEERSKYIQGIPDKLSEEQKIENEYFAGLSCVRCGEPVFPIVNGKMPFKKGKLIPNCLAKCTSCLCEFEPYSKIEVKGPTILEELDLAAPL